MLAWSNLWQVNIPEASGTNLYACIPQVQLFSRSLSIVFLRDAVISGKSLVLKLCFLRDFSVFGSKWSLKGLEAAMAGHVGGFWARTWSRRWRCGGELYGGTLIITCVNVILHSGSAIQMLNYIGSWLSGSRYQESCPSGNSSNYIIMKINF